MVLTFDDGPWAPTTPSVLKALDAQCVKATFFLIGRNAQAHPDLVSARSPTVTPWATTPGITRP